MAKIIEYNFSRKAVHGGRDLLTGSFTCYMEELDEKKQLLGELVTEARLFIEQEGMNPGDFVLSESYLKDFLFTQLHEDQELPENYAELVYLKCTGGRITALCQFAVPKKDGIMVSYQICRLDLSSEGSRRWRVYDFGSGEWLEEEEDCFEAAWAQQEYERFL